MSALLVLAHGAVVSALVLAHGAAALVLAPEPALAPALGLGLVVDLLEVDLLEVDLLEVEEQKQDLIEYPVQKELDHA